AYVKPLPGPTEARGCEVGSERALGQAGLRLTRVVAARGDVVRRVRMEERGEVLDLAAPRPELPLPAAVRADLVLGAVVVGVEEPANGAEARRLDVDRARRPGAALDIRDGVDRRVPRDASGMRLEDRARLFGHPRVLDPGVRERVEHPPVERRVRRLVGGRALVLTLEVDRVDRAGGREVGDELGGPVARRAELEAEGR